MSAKVTRLLADYGGTHLRLSSVAGAGPQNITSYKVREWPNMAAVLEDYAQKNSITLAGLTLYLAHTGHVKNGALDIGYKGIEGWAFKFADVIAQLKLKDIVPLNDLRATSYALLYKDAPLFKELRAGTPDGAPDNDCVMIGVGTGVGHSFIDPVQAQVRETYGGHFAATAVTPRQLEIAEYVRATLHDPRAMIIEDIVSGDGLYKIYEALHKMAGTQPQAKTVYDLLSVKDTDPLVREAASEFSGFLGLHAHMLCNVTHSYGGVYLSGGMLDRLNGAGLFNLNAFIENLHQIRVPVVANSLQSTPLYMAENEHIPLYGLEAYARLSA